MLICDKKIRLTRKEAGSFKRLTDWRGAPPTSVEAYNRAVREAAEEARDDSGEGRFLAALIENLRAPEL